jgi:hypothetical protein
MHLFFIPMIGWLLFLCSSSKEVVINNRILDEGSKDKEETSDQIDIDRFDVRDSWQ